MTKSITESVQAFGPLYDVTYQIVTENTGNVTLTNLTLEDDLAQFLAPATIHTAPVIAASGFTTGTANTNYDGVSDIQLLSGTPGLPVGDAGVVTLIVRIDTTNGGPAQPNTASSTSTEIQAPTESNPVPLNIGDEDGDGSPCLLYTSPSPRDS